LKEKKFLAATARAFVVAVRVNPWAPQVRDAGVPPVDVPMPLNRPPTEAMPGTTPVAAGTPGAPHDDVMPKKFQLKSVVWAQEERRRERRRSAERRGMVAGETLAG
jgi:hypothetical protein